MNKVDRTIVIKPTETHLYTLIWLHGLGDTAYGFADMFEARETPVTPNTKIVLLTAPER